MNRHVEIFTAQIKVPLADPIASFLRETLYLCTKKTLQGAGFVNT